MANRKSMLFLTLNSFSATGGIEKVCRSLSMVFGEYVKLHNKKLNVFSLYDTPDQMANNNYVDSYSCKGYSGNRISFILKAILQGKKAGVVVLSHINLLPIGWLIKIISPSTKLLVLAHGIEIWKLPLGKKSRMLNAIDHLVCVSTFTASKAEMLFAFPKKKIEVINNCLDPFLLDPTRFKEIENIRYKYKLNDSDFVMFMLSRLDSKERYKGYDHVIIAMHELIAKHPDLKFVIGGSSDAAEKKYIEELILNYGMSNHIILTGFILEDELPAHFLMSDLYIMPSNEEGFGLVFIEAIHYGLPVIAGNADGSVDALDQGNLGTLVEPGNIQHIQQGILKAIEQKGKNIPDRSILNKKFSFQTYKNQWHSLLNKCFTS